MKISIIGAGNVGGLSAMRLAQENLGSIVLVDVAAGLATAKAFDMEDSTHLLSGAWAVEGTTDLDRIENSDVVVITAGLARRPGMTREDLCAKNSQIVRELASSVVARAPQAIAIIVTNPLDIMTYVALKATGFAPERVFGMGPTLDASRFANIISKELQVSLADINPCVIGPHGEGMLPLARFTTVKGVSLDKYADAAKVAQLIKKTVGRGAEIVSLYGSGSAYFAPSAAILQLVRAVVRDEKRLLGVSAFLQGQYGLKDICCGVPCRIGRRGVEQIVELELNSDEKKAFVQAAESIKRSI